MERALRELIISEEELNELTGISDYNKIDRVRKVSRLPDPEDDVIRPSDIETLDANIGEVRGKYLRKMLYPKLFMYGIIQVLWMVLSRYFVGMPIGLMLGGVLLTFFGVSGIRHYFSIRKQVSNYIDSLEATPIGTLLDEIDNYNRVVHSIISHISVTDKLREIGHPIKIKDVKPITDVFKDIRDDLIRALKTEKVFRDNPDVKLEDFAIDFMPYRALEFDEQARECEVLVNQALEIGGRVQTKMKRLLEDIEVTQSGKQG